MTFDLDIILAAHGAGDNSPVNARVRRWARELEASHIGVRALAAFHLGTPSYEEALSATDRADTVVIPCLTSDGYHAERLRSLVGRSGRAIRVSVPIGTGGPDAFSIAPRVEEALRANGVDRAATLALIVGHGTTRNPHSERATYELAGAIHHLTGVASTAAFLDEDPLVESAVAEAGDWRTIVVVPFLLGGGYHAMHDLPKRVQSGRVARTNVRELDVILLDAPGDAEFLGQLERTIARHRSDRIIVRAAARESALSRAQVEIFARRAHAVGMDVRVDTMLTVGDGDRETPLSELNIDDAFTGTIDAALAEGRVDVAVHSLKDLPLDEPSGVRDTYLARGSAFDVLVSRGHVPLEELPKHARVGVSCPRRSQQLRLRRSDLEPVSIRGPVPDRLAALDRGEYDALVLAEAGLERLGLGARIAQRFGFREITPAAGQGAIVVRCRVDSRLLPLLSQLDDNDTRLAVETELSFARLVRQSGGGIAAAYATTSAGVINLYARRLFTGAPGFVDTTSSGADPEGVAFMAALATGLATKSPRQGVR